MGTWSLQPPVTRCWGKPILRMHGRVQPWWVAAPYTRLSRGARQTVYWGSEATHGVSSSQGKRLLFWLNPRPQGRSGCAAQGHLMCGEHSWPAQKSPTQSASFSLHSCCPQGLVGPAQVIPADSPQQRTPPYLAPAPALPCLHCRSRAEHGRMQGKALRGASQHCLGGDPPLSPLPESQTLSLPVRRTAAGGGGGGCPYKPMHSYPCFRWAGTWVGTWVLDLRASWNGRGLSDI